jgi:hypothetical protein
MSKRDFFWEFLTLEYGSICSTELSVTNQPRPRKNQFHASAARCKGDIRSSVMLHSVEWLLLTFRDNLSVPSSRVKQLRNNSSWVALPLKMGAIGGPEIPITNYQSTLRNILEEQRSQEQRFYNTLYYLYKGFITAPPLFFETFILTL